MDDDNPDNLLDELGFDLDDLKKYLAETDPIIAEYLEYIDALTLKPFWDRWISWSLKWGIKRFPDKFKPRSNRKA